MFDFTWGDAGLTIYWPSPQGQYGTLPPGAQYNPGYIPQQQTQISTGTLLLLGLGLYLLFKK